MDELNRSLENKKTQLVDLASRKATFQNTLENATQNRENLSRRLKQLTDEKDQSERELYSLKKNIVSVEDTHRNLKTNLERSETLTKSLEERLSANQRLKFISRRLSCDCWRPYLAGTPGFPLPGTRLPCCMTKVIPKTTCFSIATESPAGNRGTPWGNTYSRLSFLQRQFSRNYKYRA